MQPPRLVSVRVVIALVLAIWLVGLGSPAAGQTVPGPGPAVFLPLVQKTEADLTAGVFRKGPEVLFSGDNRAMKIVWQLDSATPSSIQWGPDGAYSGGSASVPEYGPDHQYAYTITGLAPGEKYYYQVSAGLLSSTGSFQAAPADRATQLKFFAYGDTRTNPDLHNAVDAQLLATMRADPDFQTFNLAVGDLVSDGDVEDSWSTEFFDPQYTNTRKVLANLSFLSVMGNHEGSGQLFQKYFPLPFVADRYWSFDYGPAHFVMLDQYVPYEPGSPQYAWLVNDLAASTKTWKFIALHEPGWSAGGEHPNNPIVQSVIQPLAEQYGVAIVFGGHNHYYARAVVNGIQHLTVGGGGAPLSTPEPGMPNIVTASASNSFVKVSIDGSVLTCTALRSDGTLIETFMVTR